MMTTYPSAQDHPHRIPVFHDDPQSWEEDPEPPFHPTRTPPHPDAPLIDYEPDTWTCGVCTAPIGPRIVPDYEGIYDRSVWVTCFRLTARARLQTHPDIAAKLRICEDCYDSLLD